MQSPPDYIVELYGQVAFIAAVLGGFTATFLGALLMAQADRHPVTWAIGFTAGAAVLFITATFAATVVSLYVSEGLAGGEFTLTRTLQRTKTLGDLCFFSGTYLLFIGIGLSGWARSRATGLVTASAAAVGMLTLTIVLWGVF